MCLSIGTIAIAASFPWQLGPMNKALIIVLHSHDHVIDDDDEQVFNTVKPL